MHKLLNKKRTFPDNWQNLSQEQVLENVKYLIENYKKYNIVFHGDKVQIGNIFIHKSETQILGYTYPVYVINNRMFTVYGEVGHKISELIYHCRHPEDEKNLSEKLDEFLKKRKQDLYFVLMVVVAAVMGAAVLGVNDKIKRQKQKQQEQLEKIVNQKNNQIKMLKINQKLRGL